MDKERLFTAEDAEKFNFLNKGKRELNEAALKSMQPRFFKQRVDSVKIKIIWPQSEADNLSTVLLFSASSAVKKF